MTARRAALTGIALALAACGGDLTSALPTTAPSRPPGMTIDCGDVPDDACTVVAAGYGTGSDQVIAITMRCTAPTCSTASGKTEIGLLYASGQRMSHGTDWGAVQEDPAPRPAPLAGAPQPAPVCIGIAPARCIEMAQAGDVPLGAPGVTSITVRCTRGSCVDAAGDGETFIRFQDGTRSTVGWSYGG